jgi:hypothetical protein
VERGHGAPGGVSPYFAAECKRCVVKCQAAEVKSKLNCVKKIWRLRDYIGLGWSNRVLLALMTRHVTPVPPFKG